jgi:hypothetical protein
MDDTIEEQLTIASNSDLCDLLSGVAPSYPNKTMEFANHLGRGQFGITVHFVPKGPYNYIQVILCQESCQTDDHTAVNAELLRRFTQAHQADVNFKIQFDPATSPPSS